MSQPVDPPPPPPALAPEGAPVPSTPYRVPDPPVVADDLALRTPFAPPRRAWPILGPAVSLFAVLLWSFVVAGQFTTSWMSGGPLPQAVATLFVLVTTLAAWIAAVRRSRAAAAPRTGAHLVGRTIGMGLVAFLFFLVSILGATIAGSASPRNHDFAIAFALVALSTLAAGLGLRWTWAVPPDRTHRQRVTAAWLWLAGFVVTLVAGAELAING